MKKGIIQSPCRPNKWEAPVAALSRRLWETWLFVVVTFILVIPKPGLSEDPFQIQLNNPIRYEYRFTGIYHDTVLDTLDVERVGEHQIKFKIFTMDEHVRACELERRGQCKQEEQARFCLAYGKRCRLHFKMSLDGKRITTRDDDDRCTQEFCNGFMGGITFKLS